MQEGQNQRACQGARACLAFALDMLQSQAIFNDEADQHFKLRIGINTGEVVAGVLEDYSNDVSYLSFVAGVLGSQSVSFDIWGDSVNVASRIESRRGTWMFGLAVLTN